MAQNWTDDVFDPNHEGQTDLQNIENNFACLKSQFGGLTAPANPVAGMPWVDLTSHIFKIRNEANSAWLSIFNMATGVPMGVSPDADTVDGIHASVTAVANKLLALDGTGKLPASITGTATGLTNTLAVASGGTGATTAATAADNLSVVKRDHGANTVGSITVAYDNASGGAHSAGTTIAGSSLKSGFETSGPALSGTWRALCNVAYPGFGLFQRIS